MLDFLLPTTDAGVGLQLGLWAAISVVAFVATRKNRDLRLLAIGLSILTLGLMGIRAIH